MHKHLKTAIKLGQNHKYDHSMEYELCAVITRGGTLLSVGYNKAQTNAFVEHYTDVVKGPERNYSMSTHAEMDAVMSIRAKTDLRGCKIYVARIRPPGNLDGEVLGLARPCSICQKILYAYGIRRAYYTIDDNNYGVMKIASQNESIEGDQLIAAGDW